MKIVLSRKGFDSAAGGVPSPIIAGCPRSIPIPAKNRSKTTYKQLGLADLVKELTRGQFTGSSRCHDDPMFEGGRCAFGQSGASQSHLANNQVNAGDIFLFFGLFANEDGSDPHHRFFGYLKIEEVHHLGRSPSKSDQPLGFSRRHPHTIGKWNDNNTIYIGPAKTANSASLDLRLSVPNQKITHWQVPDFLRYAGLTYHGDPARWHDDGTLTSVGRGQEFVSDISDFPDGKKWLTHVLNLIDGNGNT